MIAVSKWIHTEQSGTRLVMQVHDELVFEVPDDEVELAMRRVPELMSSVAQSARAIADRDRRRR